jgi:hypothetical protein
MSKPPFLIGVLCSLLVLQASYYLFFAWVFTNLFRGADNFSSGQTLPAAIWCYAADAIVLLALCGLLFFDLFRARKWFIVPAVAMLCYGIWAVAITQASVVDWSGILKGDFFPMEAASGACFVAIGSVELVRRGRTLFKRKGPLKEHAQEFTRSPKSSGPCP